jgi:hypothetical protein
MSLRRSVLISLALAAAAPLAGAQAYPSRPIRLVVPFGPGTTTDIVSRVYAEALGVNVEKRQPALAPQRVERGPEAGRDVADAAEPGRVEARPVTEHAAHLLVLPRRHQLEVLEERDDVTHGAVRTPEQPQRAGEVARLDQPRRLLHLHPRVLEPQLRRLVDGLEEELVAVHPLVGPLLEGEELVRTEVALVVARAVAGQDGRELVRVGSGHQIRISRPASGTPPSSVTSHVSCI